MDLNIIKIHMLDRDLDPYKTQRYGIPHESNTQDGLVQTNNCVVEYGRYGSVNGLPGPP